MYAANWYEDGKKVRQSFWVAKYGEVRARELAIEICLAAERRIPVYAEALYNRKAIVRKLTEHTGEAEWDELMPDLLAFMFEDDRR